MPKSDSFNLEILQVMDKMPIEEARPSAIKMIEESKTRPDRKFALIHDLEAANTSAEITGIMWRTYLAGTGDRVVGSEWNRRFS